MIAWWLRPLKKAWGRKQKNSSRYFGLLCVGHLQGRGRGWVHPKSPGTSCTVTATVSIPLLLVSACFCGWRGKAWAGLCCTAPGTTNPPRCKGTECTQTANHTLVAWGGPGVGWGTVTLHCLRALCLATGLGFHCARTMGCPKGPGLS